MTLLETLLALALVAILTSLAVPTFGRALVAARQQRLAAAAGQIFTAVRRYQADHGHPPAPGSLRPDGFNLRTLTPLADRGYLAGPEAILTQLKDRRVTAYDTSGPDGSSGFWLLLIDADSPELQILAASTDDFPLAPGRWLEGIYLLRGEQLEKLRGAPSLAPTRRTRAAGGPGEPPRG
ncbi:MAG: hypothetical protein Q9Q13_01815 [Acidobacteriota bacterium]|nr:hypothetical protein [Acidobacteriota bacterium]